MFHVDGHTRRTQTDRRDEANIALRNFANEPKAIPELHQHRSAVLLSLPTLNDTREISRYCEEPLLYFCLLYLPADDRKRPKHIRLPHACTLRYRITAQLL